MLASIHGTEYYMGDEGPVPPSAGHTDVAGNDTSSKTLNMP